MTFLTRIATPLPRPFMPQAEAANANPLQPPAECLALASAFGGHNSNSLCDDWHGGAGSGRSA